MTAFRYDVPTSEFFSLIHPAAVSYLSTMSIWTQSDGKHAQESQKTNCWRHYVMTLQRQKFFSGHIACKSIISVYHVNLNVIGRKTRPGEPKNGLMTSLRHDVATSEKFFGQNSMRLYHIWLPCQFEHDRTKNTTRSAKRRIDDVITSWGRDVNFWGHDFLRSVLSFAPKNIAQKKSD